MSQLSKLMVVTEEEKEKILKEHNITEKEFEDSVEVLRTWIKQHSNFPEETVFRDNQLKVALLNAKMSLEKAKQIIDGYLTSKTLYFDYLQHLVPEERFRHNVTLVKSVIMPKLLPNLSRLHVVKFMDMECEAKNGLDYYYMAMMIGEMRMLKDFFLSTSILVDMNCFGLKHLMKFPPSVNYRLAHLFAALGLRIHSVHIYNVPPIWDKINLLMKTFLPSKLMDKIKLHSSIEDLHKFIPKEYLPSDYGGTEQSMDELHEMWTKELEFNEDVFRELIKLRAKEVLKVPQFTSDIGMGIDGSFKKLEID